MLPGPQPLGRDEADFRQLLPVDHDGALGAHVEGQDQLVGAGKG